MVPAVFAASEPIIKGLQRANAAGEMQEYDEISTITRYGDSECRSCEWAYLNGIVAGRGNGITRIEAARMLYALMLKMGK